MHTDLHSPPCGTWGQGSTAGTIALSLCRVTSSLARRNISPLIDPKGTNIPELLVQQKWINLAQSEVRWPCSRCLHIEQHLHRNTQGDKWNPWRFTLGMQQSHLGFASAYFYLGSRQLAELVVKRIQFLLHLYHSWLLHLFVFGGWNADLPWLLTAFGYKRRKALHWEVQAVCFALWQTPAPLGMLTKQTRAASSSELQILTDFFPCPLILAQHSSLSCKARKSSKRPRCIIHIHVLQQWSFSRYKSIQCKFLFPE